MRLALPRPSTTMNSAPNIGRKTLNLTFGRVALYRTVFVPTLTAPKGTSLIPILPKQQSKQKYFFIKNLFAKQKYYSSKRK